MKNILFILILTTNSFTVFYGQTGIVKGKIQFQNKPETDVNIRVSGTKLGTATDTNGNYLLNTIPEGNITLLISSLGFKTIRKKTALTNNEIKTLNFNLEEDNTSLDAVVISGTLRSVTKSESPVSIEVYSKAFFKKNPNPSIFESLQNVNGVRPQLNCNVCNTGDIHINGLEGPYTFVLIDGMPIVSGLSTVYGLTGIPQSIIERVEIVKGPASTLYGSEAVGGIINIITKKPSSAPVLAVNSFGTSWKESNTDIGLHYRLSEKKEGLLGVNYFNYQNPIDKNEDGFTDLTQQNRISIFNKFNFELKNDRVFTLAGRYVYEDRWGGETDWKKTNRGGNEKYGESIYTNRWETFGTYPLPTKEKIDFQFSANGHKQNSFYGTTSYNADQLIGFGQFTWNKNIAKNHAVLVGAAYRYTFYDDNTFATISANGLNNKPSITHLPGIFAQDEIAFNKQNKLLVGVRYDYNSLHGTIFSPRLNYKWDSKDKKDVLRFSIGNGFRVANVFTEDHAALSGAREVVFEGELKPETSWNTNVNYVKKLNLGTTFIGIDASVFYTYFNNRILPDYETDTQKIIYSNLDGYSVSKGISSNFDVSFPNGLKLIAGGTLMDVSVTEAGIKTQQILTESFSGTWSLSYTFYNTNTTLDYTGNVYGPMRLPLLGDKDLRAAYSPWYSIQNIQVTQKMGAKWELYAGVKNLLNFTPAANSINSANNPFDVGVDTEKNPELAFDPSYVYASNQGIRSFLGLRYTLY